LCPSVYPNSRNRFRSAAMLRAAVAMESGDMTPTNGIVGCCARAARDHAVAAPPSSAMNARRFMFALIRAPRSTPIRETGVTEHWTASVCLDVGRPDHLAPLLRFVGNETAEITWRASEDDAAEVGELRLQLGIGEAGVDLLVELVDDLGRCVCRCA